MDSQIEKVKVYPKYFTVPDTKLIEAANEELKSAFKIFIIHLDNSIININIHFWRDITIIDI